LAIGEHLTEVNWCSFSTSKFNRKCVFNLGLRNFTALENVFPQG